MRRTKKRNSRLLDSYNKSGKSITGKVAVVVVVILVILQIFTAIQTSSMSALLAKIEHEESEMLQQTDKLASEIVSQSSLISVRERSNELGYLNPQTTLYITEQETVALQR